MKLKLKLKSNIKESIENEGSKKNDKRLLNYYDLKENEKMTILFVPDKNGELWTHYKKHGPNLNLPDAGDVNCSYSSSGEKCPACQHGFDYLNLAKETGDESYKEEAKRWFAKEYRLISCVVLESPMEINEAEDGNQVKLMHLPYAIEKIIKENVVEGLISEEQITTTPFIIKKTLNKYNKADYSSSYFAREEVSDEILDYFEDLKVEPYDYSTLDMIPKPSTAEEVREWLEKAIEIDEKADKSKDKKGGNATADKPSYSNNKKKEEVSAPNTNDNNDGEEVADNKPAGSLADRLSRLRKS